MDIGGGLFHFESLVAVFMEFSIDGGQTWIPNLGGPNRVTLGSRPDASLGRAPAALTTVAIARGYRHSLRAG